MDVPEGLRGSEHFTALSVVENKMRSFTWNAPPTIREVRDSGLFTFMAVLFENIYRCASKISLFHKGWNYPGEKWVETDAYFAAAWDFVLKAQKAELVQNRAKIRSSKH